MHNIYLIFRRDFLGYVKAWGFWLSLAAVPIFLVIGAGFGYFAASSSPVRYYAVIEPSGAISEAIDAEFRRSEERVIEDAMEIAGGMDANMSEMQAAATAPRKFIEVDAPADSIEALRPYLLGEKLVAGPDGDKPLFAVFLLTEDGSALQYWSTDVNVSALRYAAETAMRDLGRRDALIAAGLSADFLKKVDEAIVPVTAFRLRSEAEPETGGSEVTMADKAPAMVAGALAYFLWLMVFSIIQYLLMGTIEERSNKIFDTLLTSVTLPELLAGKLLAVFAVTSTMMLSWGLFAGAGSAIAASQSPELMEMIDPFIAAVTNPGLIIPALISFILGYVLYGAIFMALGSLCDTIQEAQTLLSPMMILLMLPMFAIFVAFQDPGSPVIDYASWVPLFTPFLLILRIPQDPPLWEILAQMALMAMTTALIVWGATKVYRAGAVHGAGIGDLVGMVKSAMGMKPKAS